MQINSNSQFIQRMLGNSQSTLEQRMEKLASALRINSAADDAAGLAVAEGLRSQMNGLDQAARNTLDNISLLQTTKNKIQKIQNITQRLRTLSVQASNGTLTDEDRALIQTEVTQLTGEINRMAGTVQYNGRNLLDGSSTTLQVGANQSQTVTASTTAMTTTALGLNGIDVSTPAGAEAALGQIDQAISSVSGQRAAIGAQENSLRSTFSFNQIQNENMLAAESRVRDADMAAELVGMTLAQMRNQTGLAMLAQSNLNQQSTLNLFG